jgi:hypothetical protein
MVKGFEVRGKWLCDDRTFSIRYAPMNARSDQGAIQYELHIHEPDRGYFCRSEISSMDQCLQWLSSWWLSSPASKGCTMKSACVFGYKHNPTYERDLPCPLYVPIPSFHTFATVFQTLVFSARLDQEEHRFVNTEADSVHREMFFSDDQNTRGWLS